MVSFCGNSTYDRISIMYSSNPKCPNLSQAFLLFYLFLFGFLTCCFKLEQRALFSKDPAGYGLVAQSTGARGPALSTGRFPIPCSEPPQESLKASSEDTGLHLPFPVGASLGRWNFPVQALLGPLPHHSSPPSPVPRSLVAADTGSNRTPHDAWTQVPGGGHDLPLLPAACPPPAPRIACGQGWPVVNSPRSLPAGSGMSNP